MVCFWQAVEISIHALVKRATGGKRKMKKVNVISIHALVKRATFGQYATAASQQISIHALVKRATTRQYPRNGKFLNFNPRPREEGDAFQDAVKLYTDWISIHALVKRATANLYNDYLYFEAKYHISDIFHQ